MKDKKFKSYMRLEKNEDTFNKRGKVWKLYQELFFFFLFITAVWFWHILDGMVFTHLNILVHLPTPQHRPASSCQCSVQPQEGVL